MRTPDLTPAQIVSLIGSALTLAITFGVHMSLDQRGAILAFVGAVLGVLVHSDAKIRHGRATGANADLTRKIIAAATPAADPEA